MNPCASCKGLRISTHFVILSNAECDIVPLVEKTSVSADVSMLRLLVFILVLLMILLTMEVVCWDVPIVDVYFGHYIESSSRASVTSGA